MGRVEQEKSRASKLSVSLPAEMVNFVDDQCRAFGVGRSTYLQMLLHAEQAEPRKEFTKRARAK
jgi:hypothetical protein